MHHAEVRVNSIPDPSDPRVRLVQDWAERFYSYAMDTDGRRERWLSARKSWLPSAVSPDWHETYKEFDEVGRLLGLDLRDRAMPAAQSLSVALARILDEAAEALAKLRFAVRDIMSDVDLTEMHRAAEKMTAFEVTQFRKGVLVGANCFECKEHFTNGGDLEIHFETRHPRPRAGEFVFLDPPTHRLNILQAMGPCAEAYRRIQAWRYGDPGELGDGSSSLVESSAASPPSLAADETRCRSWLKEQVAAGIRWTRADALVEARRLIGSRLSKRAFERAWAEGVPDVWKRPGRRSARRMDADSQGGKSSQ
jgi:hypothetical protein